MSQNNRKKSLSQALNSTVRKYGNLIVSNLAIAVKTTQLYSFAHQNVVEALRELEGFLASFVRLEGDAHISRVEDFLFINEVRVRSDLGGLQTYQFIVELLKQREIGSITFKTGIAGPELTRLVDMLVQPVRTPQDPWAEFSALLGPAKLENIQVEKYVGVEDKEIILPDDARTLAIGLFFRAIQLLEDAFQAVEADRKMALKRMKRIVQGMVDLILEEQATLLALTNIRDHVSRRANHGVNVAILTLATGAKLGLSKKLLGDLATTALLHDIGELRLPERLRDRSLADLGGEELRTFEDHVYAGAEVLLHQRINDAVVKSMNVAFLHHFRFDGTGFPRTHLVKEQNLFSRIVTVCDVYDELSARSQQRDAMPPGEIMRYLLDGSGTEFDPLVVKAFVNLLGLYPIGCIVLLDDGSVATVIAPPTHSRFLDRPTVRVFTDEHGGPTDRVVDLMARSAEGFERSILKLFQHEEVEIEMDEYLSVL